MLLKNTGPVKFPSENSWLTTPSPVKPACHETKWLKRFYQQGHRAVNSRREYRYLSRCRPWRVVLFFSVLSGFGIIPACSDDCLSLTPGTQRTQQCLLSKTDSTEAVFSAWRFLACSCCWLACPLPGRPNGRRSSPRRTFATVSRLPPGVNKRWGSAAAWASPRFTLKFSATAIRLTPQRSRPHETFSAMPACRFPAASPPLDWANLQQGGRSRPATPTAATSSIWQKSSATPPACSTKS